MSNIGNKAPGGGSTVTTNGTSITIDGVTTAIPVGLDQSAVDARVTALCAESALQANASKLKRVDTGVWETGQAGVEYYSPDQRGGFYGVIYRALYSGTTGAPTVTIAASFHTTKRLVGQGGYVTDSATGSTLTLPTYFGAVSNAGLNDNELQQALEKIEETPSDDGLIVGLTDELKED